MTGNQELTELLAEANARAERAEAALLSAFPPDLTIDGEPWWNVGGFRLRTGKGFDVAAARVSFAEEVAAWVESAPFPEAARTAVYIRAIGARGATMKLDDGTNRGGA